MGEFIIVVPCYDEAEALPSFLEEIDKVGVAVLFVNDGSTDNTLTLIKKSGYLYLDLKEHVGKQRAIQKGLELALALNYEYFGVMDADLQDNPKLLSSMLETIKCVSSLDQIVVCRKNVFYSSVLKDLAYLAFYGIAKIKGGVVFGERDYRVMQRELVMKVVNNYREPFSKVCNHYAKSTMLLRCHYSKREYGVTKFSMGELIKHAFSLLQNKGELL